jgi:nitrogen regulatory protein PII 2
LKQIVAYIRPDKHFATRDALEKAGFGAYHVENVSGRGRQGLVYEMIEGGIISPESAGGQMFAKKELAIAVADDEADIVVNIIIETNHTGMKGDGKIFVMPLCNAIRIRTGEEGEGALL